MCIIADQSQATSVNHRINYDEANLRLSHNRHCGLGCFLKDDVSVVVEYSCGEPFVPSVLVFKVGDRPYKYR